MSISRREFLQVLAIASASGISLSACDSGSDTRNQGAGAKPNKAPGNMYEVPAFGNVSLMHFTDCHAQLTPMYFREPSINLGFGIMRNKPPHLVGEHFLKKFGIAPGSAEAYAFTYPGFIEAAKKFGKLGGFSHMATLIKNLRAQRPGALLLDGGDTWQGSATSLWSNGQDMVDAQKLLGVDVMTGHWEFTYGQDRVKEIIEKDFKDSIEFLAQNVVDNEFEEGVFKPYTVKIVNGIKVGIIGQAFPYTPIANPRYLIPDWSFGIREDQMQETVDSARGEGGAQVVVLLSHNGMDVDLKMAGRVTGIDAIMGGHTHDAVPAPVVISNPGGKTLVINSGAYGKFLSVLDFDVKNGKVSDYRFKMLPIFSNLIEPDKAMEEHINKVRAPHKSKLDEKLAVTEDLLYRRGNFNGTFDQLICDALMEVKNAQMSFSPGFRWGASVLPGQPITFEDVMTQTAMTYPVVTLNNIKGDQIKNILEDVADNLFNKDPYYQQGGDMVRVGGLKYTIDPLADIGRRITDMELDGKPLNANKEYSVAGWASVQPQKGTPVWEVVAEYLRNKKTVKISDLNVPKIKNTAGNQGIA